MQPTVTQLFKTNNSIQMRKGLSAIAKRQTGLMKSKPQAAITCAENIAAPKELSAAKCHSISFLTL